MKKHILKVVCATFLISSVACASSTTGTSGSATNVSVKTVVDTKENGLKFIVLSAKKSGGDIIIVFSSVENSTDKPITISGAMAASVTNEVVMYTGKPENGVKVDTVEISAGSKKSDLYVALKAPKFPIKGPFAISFASSSGQESKIQSVNIDYKE